LNRITRCCVGSAVEFGGANQFLQLCVQAWAGRQFVPQQESARRAKAVKSLACGDCRADNKEHNNEKSDFGIGSFGVAVRIRA
jgi:hypothetical protein